MDRGRHSSPPGTVQSNTTAWRSSIQTSLPSTFVVIPQRSPRSFVIRPATGPMALAEMGPPFYLRQRTRTTASAPAPRQRGTPGQAVDIAPL